MYNVVMTIRRRLRISYTLLVTIPLALFIVSAIILGADYFDRVKLIQETVQTRKFNSKLYSKLTEDPTYLLSKANLEELISLTADPESITAFVTIDGSLYLSAGANPQSQPQENDSDRHLNYWNFYFRNGRKGELLMRYKALKLEKFVFSLVGPATLYIILIVLLTYLTSKTITRPLRRLKEAAISIKNEEFDVDINYSGKDEIKEVFTAFDEMRLRLKQIMEKQLKYEKDRTELITNISHDLKTPITAIKGYIEGIVDGVANTPEKIDRYHKTIYKKITLLDKLIENLFLFSKLDLKTVIFNFQKLDLNMFIEDIVEEVRYDAPNLKISFNHCNENLYTMGDPIQLQRVIHNLVANSIKYCDKEYCNVNIELIREEDMARISVKDNGSGINPECLTQIFKRFYRSDPARCSSTEGSGLGLAISKQIILEHKGSISAFNNIDKGVTITFKLPLSGDHL